MENIIFWVAVTVFFGLPLVLTGGTLILHVLDVLAQPKTTSGFPRMREIMKGVDGKPIRK